jgi:hypothetical protein
VLKLTRSWAAAWRIRRHHLDKRAPTGSMLAVASRLGGLHAELTSSAEYLLPAAELPMWHAALGTAGGT